MIDIDRILKSDRVTRSMIGMNPGQFHDMVPQFEQELTSIRIFDYQKNPRKIAMGSGRPPHALQEGRKKLFYILTYYKCYPTFDVAGVLFGIDRSNAFRWKEKLEDALEQSLKMKKQLPKRKIRSLDEFLEAIPEATGFFIDGSERRIRRPKDRKEQKKHYSGKKKMHTVKNQLGVTPDKRIAWLSATNEGKKHDYRQLTESTLPEHIPKHIPVGLDSAYIGLKKDYPDGRWVVPTKKPKGKILTEVQKSQNKTLSSLRIIAENAIAGVKRYQIVASTFRNRRTRTDQAMINATGLWNYYLSSITQTFRRVLLVLIIISQQVYYPSLPKQLRFVSVVVAFMTLSELNNQLAYQ